MLEKSQHYSNKGGHKIRGLINKLIREKVIEDKREVSLCLEENIEKVSYDEKD